MSEPSEKAMEAAAKVWPQRNHFTKEIALALDAFAAEARAEEREECALEAEQQACAQGLRIGEDDPPHELECALCRQSIRVALAIRARGQR